MKMIIRLTVAAVALLGMAAVVAPPRNAAAHGSGYYYYDPPPVIVVPRGGRHGREYPSWYYGRPVPRGYGQPYVVVPAPRYYAPPPRRHRGPDFSFSFRF